MTRSGRRRTSGAGRGRLQQDRVVHDRAGEVGRLEGGEEALKALCEEHPDLDRQRLGQAVRAARREAKGGVPGRRYELPFQVLRELGLGQDAPE